MWFHVNRFAATLSFAFVAMAILVTHRGPRELIVVSLFGWFLAFYGDEVGPLLNVKSDSSTTELVAPFIRSIGWVFLAASGGLAIAYVAKYIR